MGWVVVEVGLALGVEGDRRAATPAYIKRRQRVAQHFQHNFFVSSSSSSSMSIPERQQPSSSVSLDQLLADLYQLIGELLLIRRPRVYNAAGTLVLSELLSWFNNNLWVVVTVSNILKYDLYLKRVS